MLQQKGGERGERDSSKKKREDLPSSFMLSLNIWIQNKNFYVILWIPVEVSFLCHNRLNFYKNINFFEKYILELNNNKLEKEIEVWDIS